MSLSRRFDWFAANALAGFMDIGAGLLLGALFVYVWHLPLFPALAVGAFAAILPDMDILIPILRGHVEGNHRASLLHRPLLVIPGSVCLTYSLVYFTGVGGRDAWAGLMLSGVIWHYVHDTPPLCTAGVAWLWPFYREPIIIASGGRPLKGLTHEVWLEQVWMWPSPRLMRELLIGTLCSILASQLSCSIVPALPAIAAWCVLCTRFAKRKLQTQK